MKAIAVLKAIIFENILITTERTLFFKREIDLPSEIISIGNEISISMPELTALFKISRVVWNEKSNTTYIILNNKYFDRVDSFGPFLPMLGGSWTKTAEDEIIELFNFQP